MARGKRRSNRRQAGLDRANPKAICRKDAQTTREGHTLERRRASQGFSGAFFTSQVMTSGQWFSLRKVQYSFWPFRK